MYVYSAGMASDGMRERRREGRGWYQLTPLRRGDILTFSPNHWGCVLQLRNFVRCFVHDSDVVNGTGLNGFIVEKISPWYPSVLCGSTVSWYCTVATYPVLR